MSRFTMKYIYATDCICVALLCCVLADDKRSKIDKTEVNVTLFYERLSEQFVNESRVI